MEVKKNILSSCTILWKFNAGQSRARLQVEVVIIFCLWLLFDKSYDCHKHNDWQALMKKWALLHHQSSFKSQSVSRKVVLRLDQVMEKFNLLNMPSRLASSVVSRSRFGDRIKISGQSYKTKYLLFCVRTWYPRLCACTVFWFRSVMCQLRESGWKG